jgi:hypothetical protein
MLPSPVFFDFGSVARLHTPLERQILLFQQRRVAAPELQHVVRFLLRSEQNRVFRYHFRVGRYLPDDLVTSLHTQKTQGDNQCRRDEQHRHRNQQMQAGKPAVQDSPKGKRQKPAQAHFEEYSDHNRPGICHRCRIFRKNLRHTGQDQPV